MSCELELKFHLVICRALHPLSKATAIALFTRLSTKLRGAILPGQIKSTAYTKDNQKRLGVVECYRNTQFDHLKYTSRE